MKFILISHTTTDWCLVGRLKGQTDRELTKPGRTEALKLASKLKNLGISKIVSSDLKRASQTAEIINTQLKVPITSDALLRECSFGSLEGMTKEEAVAKYGPMIIKDWDDQCESYDFKRFGGEDREEVLKHHLKLLKKYSGSNLKETAILLVGHERGLDTLLAGLGHKLLMAPGEYRIIDFTGQ